MVWSKMHAWASEKRPCFPHQRLWTDELCSVSDPMLLLILTAAGSMLLILLVLLVTCVAVWRKRRVTQSRVITQNQCPCSPVPVFWNVRSLACFHLLSWCFLLFSVSVESYDSAHDYEKVEAEKAEHAAHVNLGDHLYEDSFQGEPFGGGTSEDEEEADYVNVTTECNVQFVEIYGVSGSNVLVLNATSEDAEFIDIYGEEDCIYQNMSLGWSTETKRSTQEIEYVTYEMWWTFTTYQIFEQPCVYHARHVEIYDLLRI